jgi:ubiquinone/menaquinone biosynthesis C-methylase UbiE
MAEVTDRWAAGAAYEVFMGRWSRRLARQFVDWLDVEPRAHWLDVGCGTGALTAAICELRNPASVIACDPSGPLLEMASATLADKRVCFEIAQAERPPEREGGFDVVVSGLVLNFVADPRRALAAMAGRLTPRGGVAAYVWDYAQGMEFLLHFWRHAVALDRDAAPLAEDVRFAGWNAAALAELFRASGLAHVATKAIELETNFAGFDDYWQPFLGRTGPAPSYLASLAPERREALKERLRLHLPTQSDGRICLMARAWAVRGSRADAR